MKYTLLALALLSVASFVAEKQPLPTAHTTRNIEGWTVRVDDRLLKGEHAAAGTRALKLLEARLVAITAVVPEKSLAKLRCIIIELDLNYGDLRAMQYHPDAGWLKEHGYNERLAKCVHIPEIKDFMEPQGIHGQPWVVLHELAHGYRAASPHHQSLIPPLSSWSSHRFRTIILGNYSETLLPRSIYWNLAGVSCNVQRLVVGGQ